MHNINITGGKASCMVVGEKAWHGLGQILDSPATAEQAIIEAGLDYKVEIAPVFFTDGNNKVRQVAKANATYRTDTNESFGIVGDRYTVLQNKEAFGFFDAIVGEGEAIYETAGALGNGEVVWIAAKLPAYIRVGRDDLIEQYLFLTNRHDGKGCVQAAFTPVRIVCNNTLNAALRRNANRVRMRHTTHIEMRLKEAHKLMGITSRLKEEIEGCFNRFARVRVTDKQVRALIEEALAPSKEQIDEEEFSTRFTNTIDDIMTFTLGHETQQTETCKGTLFGVYNGLTGYYQHEYEFKSDENKFESITMGYTATKTQKMMNTLLRFEKSN